MRIELVATWLLTFTLHAGVLLIIAWVIDRGILRTRLAWRELLWRVALFGGALTAPAQTLFEVPSATRIALPAAAVQSVRTGAANAATHVAPTQIGSRTMELASSVSADALAASASLATKVRPRETFLVAGSAARPPSWQALLVAGWLAGALVMLVRLGAAWCRLECTLARAMPATQASLAIDAKALAIQARIAAPHVAALEDLASPLAACGGRIVVPCWSLELLDREQVRAMLAHETAHLARRDPAWKLGTAFWCALLWFLPLTALARRRLDEVAELSCDAWAVVHLGNGRSLAECLAECAERRVGFDADLVPAMAHRDSPLLQRIDHLIGESNMDMNFSRTSARIAAGLALALAAAVLPGFGTSRAAALQPPAPPVPPAAPAENSASHVHVSSDTGLFGKRRQHTTVEINDGRRGYSAKINGEVEFTEHEDDVASLGDGSSASFSETVDGTTRRVEYASDAGKVTQRYFVGGREQPVDATARTWIAGLLPTVIRETALNAKQRVLRLHAGGGANAVFDEIARIKSDYARGVYLKELVATAKLSPAEVTRALGLIDGIDSDYERRNVLAALAAADPLDAAQQKLVMQQAAKIGSDYERAELLVGILPKLAPDTGVRAAWLEAASSIGSDYEHRRVLSALLDAGNVDDATLAQIIANAKSIGSDYERRELLTDAMRRIGDAERVAPAYAEAISGIGSDYERREALLALIEAPRFGAAGTRAVLDAAEQIGSDYECREVLVALARVMPEDAGLIARYRSVARRLSDTERGAAERALDRFAS